MNKPAFSLTLIILLSSISLAEATEELLPQHLTQIESLQRRADKLAFGELGSNNYHLAKARAWLDLALSEYHEKDSGGIVPAAVAQAEVLLDALDKKQADITMGTPMQLPGSEKVRPDLWDRIVALKNNAKSSCGLRQVAEAEVHLVWAGHEKAESGWSHAQPYARSAEELIHEAQVAINDCAAAALTSAAEPLAAQRVIEIKMPPSDVPLTRTLPAPHVEIEKITLSSDALFAFKETKLNPSSLWRLNRLADIIKSLTVLDGVALVGHTDHYGSAAYNQTLSEKRTESIKQYLISKGVAEEKIHASGVGSEQPLVLCPGMPKAEQVICLRPNRRVEIILRGVKQ